MSDDTTTNTDSLERRRYVPPKGQRLRCALALVFTAMGVFVLASGSIIIGMAFLGIDVSPEAEAYSFFYIWPFTMVLYCLLGICALIAAQRNRLGSWIWICFSAWGTFAIAALCLGVAMALMDRRLNVLIIPLLLIVDGFALYAGWHRIFRRSPAGASGRMTSK